MESMLTAALCALAMNAQDTKLPEVKMGTAQLVFLVAPTDPPKFTKEEEDKKQGEHLKFLQGLWDSRKALLVGPLSGAGRRKGICVIDVETGEEAKRVLAQDTWVSSGALEAETHTWFFAKNYLAKGAGFMEIRKYWFGLLERPANPPDIENAKLEEMQKGHMANIQKMAGEGFLLLAGPMKESGALRGIFVFKDMPKDKVLELTWVDPLIKSGRLKLTLFPWFTARGSFVAEK